MPTAQKVASKPPSDKVSAPVVSRLVNVSKIYGSGPTKVVALDDVSIEISQGEFVAIMGPSGCGKSTFLHCAAALDRVSSGQVEIAGQNITNLSDKDLTVLRRKMIGFVFQHYNLIPTLTAQENIMLPFKIAKVALGSKEASEFFKNLTKALGLKDRLRHLPNQLSGGQQQRVAVARALMTQPAVIFADEPSGNLDSKASKELLQLLKGANESYDQTMVVVTHSPFVASFANRILFLADGKIVEDSHQTSIKAIRTRLETL